MNLQQMRYIYEVAHRNLNVSEAALALFTSQPGVSKQIRLLEEELSLAIFVRRGKRLVGITEPGQQVLRIAERLLRDIENLRQVGAEFSNEASGHLTIATTHMQARYVLPPIIQQFMLRYPKVSLSLRQGNPVQVCEYVLRGEADIVIATEAIEHYDDLVALPCYSWNRCVVTLPDHPLLKITPLTLEAIVQYPIITYDSAFTGRSQLNKAFSMKGLSPNIVLTAIDADVIKTYVALGLELGLGIGIIAEMAYDQSADKNLSAIPVAHLFESATTRIGLRANDYLRGYTYSFIELFAPHLTRKRVNQALAGLEQENEKT